MPVCFLCALYLLSCSSGSHVNQNRISPVIPDITAAGTVPLESTGHILWGYYLVRIDENDYSAEIIPIRVTASHLNVLQFLEQAPCTGCFKLAGITPNPDGTLNVNVSIQHPFTNMNLTGFDVRGIALFNGSYVFPESGLVMPDRTKGEGEVVNADGYTALYNPTTVGHGLESYMKGKLATATPPNATLNGYKRFITDNPANTRNAFYAGEEIIVTFQVDMPNPPNPWIFGYAVDASWAPPISKPVIDPMTDFGPEANCPEGWKIEVTDTPIGNGLTDCGGQTNFTIDIYDWQGKDDAYPVVVECPELFDGEVEATWKADGIGFTIHEAVVENAKNAPAGFYRCLVSKEAQENDPLKPWLDITAYQLHEVEVVVATKMPPTAVADASQLSAYVDEIISFDASGSYDNDCGNQSIVNYEWDWSSDGTYDQQGVQADHSWSAEGIYQVQLRATDDEAQTDTLDVPLEVIILSDDGTVSWAKRAGGTNDDYGSGITTLSDNSTVVTGWFNGSATFGPGEPNQTVLTTAGFCDIFIARYNPDGALAWAKGAGGFAAIGNAITTLSDNSTVVTGYFYGSATFGPGEPNQTVLTSDGGQDIFIARYNPDGILAWAKRAGGASDDEGYGITTLSDNSTVVTGQFSEWATFGPGEPNQIVLTSAGSVGIFVARYNPDGTLAWAASAGGADFDKGYGITTLSDNSTVVIGEFYDSATFGPGEPNQTVLTSAGFDDIFIARYNPDGTLVWAKSAGGASWNDLGNGITAHSDNSTVVTGWFEASATFGPGEPNQTVLTSDGGQDIFIARYNPDGTLAWAKSAGGVSSPDSGYGITTLSDNSTVATGSFSESATFGAGEPNETVLTSAGDGDWDIFIARYNPDGTLTWAKSAGGASGYDEGYGITTLSDNSTVVTGRFEASATFGPGEPNETVLASDGAYDIFIARFEP